MSVSLSLQGLIQLAKNAKEFSFGSHSIRSLHSGQHSSRLMGRGMEFAETRRYQAGDDIRTIDWRVTARTGKAHTKLFEVEKERQVVCCVDLRRPMFFATKGVFKSVQAATFAGYIAWNAVHEGNCIGGLIFDDSGATEIRPMKGKKGAMHLLQALAKQGAFSKDKLQRENYPPMDDAMSRLAHLVRPGSLVFILSDFRKPPIAMRETLFRIAKHSDVVLGFLYDPIEEALPKGYNLPVACGVKEFELSTYQTKALEGYHSRFLLRKQEVEAYARHPHIHFQSCSTENNVLEELRCWRT